MNSPDLSKMKQDCSNSKECLEMLQMILDGEATTQQKEHFLKEHLEQCMPCYKNYHLEVAIRELLKTKCTSHAPQELVDNIRKQVSQKLAS
ncbi:anti-sigma factor [Fulvivirgaceae bacterium PWU4]|uniref:Anti-sigma factor n=1 Tax=Chryseosolibacter histidini TaxID=2782349 RepID=A0AAP2GS89_9BACT|nr:anti-sigma factor [Chryseosolibacter histidini]MBT1700432.1 anti-sigma factor [Chryseosolibacter histidini]